MEAASINAAIAEPAGARSPLQKAAALVQRKWLRYVFLALLGLAVHFPALQGELIWDDSFLARDNPFIKSPVLMVEAFRQYARMPEPTRQELDFNGLVREVLMLYESLAGRLQVELA